MARTLINSIDFNEVRNEIAKNVIIGGGLDNWQRGITDNGVPFSDAYTTVDRFYTRVGGNITTRLFEQSTDIPAELQNIVDYSMHITGTGTNTFNMRLGHKIESKFIKHLSNKTVQISFYVKQENVLSFDMEAYVPVTKDSHGSAGAGDTQILNLVDIQGITNTWSRYTYDIALGDVSNGLHLILEWNADNLATPDVHIAGVMLCEAGVNDIPFERAGRDITEEFRLCKRYFEDSYLLHSDTRNTTNTGNSYPFNWNVYFSVEKRIPPSMVMKLNNTSFSSTQFYQIRTNGFCFGAGSGATGAGASSYIYTDGWTADAEL